MVINVDIRHMNDFLTTKLLWHSLSWTSKFLVSYGLIMLLALVICYVWSLSDHRLIREVGVWVKPMKFILIVLQKKMAHLN